jgi:hypothetical protein
LAPRFALTEKQWPSVPGQASICLWEDDKTAAFSFSIDDNCPWDVPFWKDLEKQYGDMKLTWNLITLNLDGVYDLRHKNSAGTFEFWRGVIADGGHVASHSVTHVADPTPADGWPGPVWEAAQSLATLNSNLGGYHTKLFVYPGAVVPEFNVSPTWRREVAMYFAGARGYSGQTCINIANQTDYFDIRSASHPDVLLSDDPKLLDQDIRNTVAKSDDPRRAKYYRGWATSFVHSINQGKDWGQTPLSKGVIALFDWVSKHRDDLWVGYLDDVALYGQERDTGSVTTVKTTPKLIVLNLSSQMDPRVFDYPLTVKAALPAEWAGKCVARAGTASLPVAVVRHGDCDFALVKAVPNGPDITLSSE